MATGSTEVGPPLGTKMDELYKLMGEEPGEEFRMKQSELEQLKVAMKDETFRKLLNDYVEEVRDPENQVTYQSEMRELEKERGNMAHFVNPIGNYVLKTSINGETKGFINICSNPLIRKPSFEVGVQNNVRGSIWSVPYTQSPGREDYDKAGQKCMVYDVIFNPEALEHAKQNSLLQQKLEETAFDAVERNFKVTLDKVNVRRPKLKYKGLRTPAIIKYKIGEAVPTVLDPDQLGKEIPPERDEQLVTQNSSKSKKSKETNNKKTDRANLNSLAHCTTNANESPISHTKIDYTEWTHPKFALKYRSHVDLQNFCTEFQRLNVNANVPDEIVLTIDLPLLKDSTSLDADVIDQGNGFELQSDEKALYYLKVKFPYPVIEDSAKATFDKDKRKLVVCMRTVKTAIPLKTIENANQDSNRVSVDNTNPKYEAEDSDGVPTDFNAHLQPVLEDLFEGSGECSPETGPSLIGSPVEKKTVRFSDEVKRQIYRSNSSILGQRKKNQRKAKSRRNRLNSTESISSVDEDEDQSCGDLGIEKGILRQRFYSGESVSSLEDEEIGKFSSGF